MRLDLERLIHYRAQQPASVVTQPAGDARPLVKQALFPREIWPTTKDKTLAWRARPQDRQCRTRQRNDKVAAGFDAGAGQLDPFLREIDFVPVQGRNLGAPWTKQK